MVHILNICNNYLINGCVKFKQLFSQLMMNCCFFFILCGCNLNILGPLTVEDVISLGKCDFCL